MPFLKSIDDLREIDWASTYTWDIRFIDQPTHKSQLTGKFRDFFPAIDFRESVAGLKTYSFSTPMIQGFQIPEAGQGRSLSITFHDDASGSLIKWIRNWINIDILNNGEYVSTLEKSVKNLTVEKLTSYSSAGDGLRDVVWTRNYWVFPTGEITEMGDSGPSAVACSYSCSFFIAGGSDQDPNAQDSAGKTRQWKL